MPVDFWKEYPFSIRRAEIMSALVSEPGIQNLLPRGLWVGRYKFDTGKCLYCRDNIVGQRLIETEHNDPCASDTIWWIDQAQERHGSIR